ncbi:hypothetical protein ABH922_004998 [Rhodococcus sp. 27YEA15]
MYSVVAALAFAVNYRHVLPTLSAPFTRSEANRSEEPQAPTYDADRSTLGKP